MSDFRVIRPAHRQLETASGGLRREAAVSGELVGAERMWFGYAELGPGAVSAVHHHGHSESGIYIVSGAARFCSGDELTDVHDAVAGDFVWVPPNVVHVEINASLDEPVVMAVTRSTQEAIVVNLPSPDGWAPPREEPAMAERYASGSWHVREGSADEFVDRWREFLGWTRENHPALGSATLLRSEAQPDRFVSFATWGSTDERDAWKQSEGFMERFTACRELCDGFDGGDFERVVAL